MVWTLTQHNLIHMIANSIYYIYYHYEFPCIERYKTNWEEPWPWHTDPQAWQAQIRKAVPVFLFNSNVMVALMFLTLEATGQLEEHDMLEQSLPTASVLMASVFFCMICEDFTFYWMHRLLHKPCLYPYVHKMHHQFTQTVSIAAEYSHPLEFVLGNLIPTSVGPLILGPKMHIVTVFAWYFVRVCETLDGHCGYEFSFSPYRLIPMSGSAEYHDYHHSRNIGNYASFFSVWDTVFGTNASFNHRSDQKKRL